MPLECCYNNSNLFPGTLQTAIATFPSIMINVMSSNQEKNKHIVLQVTDMIQNQTQGFCWCLEMSTVNAACFWEFQQCLCERKQIFGATLFSSSQSQGRADVMQRNVSHIPQPFSTWPHLPWSWEEHQVSPSVGTANRVTVSTSSLWKAEQDLPEVYFLPSEAWRATCTPTAVRKTRWA